MPAAAAAAAAAAAEAEAGWALLCPRAFCSFVANSLENSTEVGLNWDRHRFNANVSMQDLVSDYLPPFQSCVERGSAGLMCSYSECEDPRAC